MSHVVNKTVNNWLGKEALVSRLPLFIIIIVLISLIAYLTWPEKQVEKSQYKRFVAVKMTPVILTDFIESVEAVGTASANEQVKITSKKSDLVDEVYFSDGEKVKKGELLVTLNNQEEHAKVSELSANLLESQAHLKRLSDLLLSNATSMSLVEQQVAKTKAIEAQLLSAQARLNDTGIRAPFAGVLGFREISRGAYIDAGTIITSLDDLSQIKVDFYLPERLFTKINIDQKITAFNTAYDEKAFVGKVIAIDSRIDPKTRSMKVRAIIANPSGKLRPGMLLNISVLLQIEKIFQLPESAIIPIEDKHYVFVVNEEKALRKRIEIGRRHPGFVEISSGLIEGELVVVEGALKLRDGTAVTIIDQKDEKPVVKSEMKNSVSQGSKT
ncbi:MAG: membrane fusion protein (multidrug efflux system) [Alteromonadaceae bacterium]|jgi:membrane fusion protein (multidrug efflux system)